jgi:hypothetical protein
LDLFSRVCFRFAARESDEQLLTASIPRHCGAIAELMGLPKAFQSVQIIDGVGGNPDEAQRQKAQLWSSLCSLDRMFGMITNLPPGTTRYQQTTSQALIIDGKVQLGVYLTRLTS